jgi:hypothetical protein
MKQWLVLAVTALVLSSAGCIKEAAAAASKACGALSGKNQDHCYQGIAVRTDNPDMCEFIQAEDFKQYGSKPPKDKCFLMIAENTGDKALCDKIRGGTYSYTKEGCLENIRTGKKTE